MPIAGDEGYEKMVICPYDKAHEIRRGRMQFHLDKCRKNYPNADITQCPFNTSHWIPRVELGFHNESDCISRTVWDRHNYEVGDNNCPVKDLVPVNVATVPDGEENWDNYEATGSVLNIIKEQAAEKNIVRMLQCESKAKRKNFRKQEHQRHALLKEGIIPPASKEDTGSVVSTSEPLPKPKKKPNIQVKTQDPAIAVAALNKQFRTLDLNMKTEVDSAPSETSSMYNAPASEARMPSTSETASLRPSTSMSCTSRMSTAASIAESVWKLQKPATAMPVPDPDEDGFCQIPIPGLGRGKRRVYQ